MPKAPQKKPKYINKEAAGIIRFMVNSEHGEIEVEKEVKVFGYFMVEEIDGKKLPKGNHVISVYMRNRNNVWEKLNKEELNGQISSSYELDKLIKDCKYLLDESSKDLVSKAKTPNMEWASDPVMVR